jgi:hypothetical protein
MMCNESMTLLKCVCYFELAALDLANGPDIPGNNACIRVEESNINILVICIFKPQLWMSL